MKVTVWNPERHNGKIIEAGMVRLVKAADVVAEKARENCPVGTQSRPMYETGKYAGQPWTRRDGGMLKRSIRVRRLREKEYVTDVLGQHRNVRVYAGTYANRDDENPYYAAIVEFYTPYIRNSVRQTRARVKDILENG